MNDYEFASATHLHGLTDVTMEAAAPDEIASRGAGLEIARGAACTPFGLAFIAQCQRGICHLSFHDSPDRGAMLAALRAEWPCARFLDDDETAARLAAALFSPAAGDAAQPSAAAWRVYVKGTAFQLKVWRALLAIPPGGLTSYAQIAAAVGNPKAARAVGNAVGKNAVAFLIPCHRAVRGGGAAPGGYRWGAERKRALIAWEKKRAEQED